MRASEALENQSAETLRVLNRFPWMTVAELLALGIDEAERCAAEVDSAPTSRLQAICTGSVGIIITSVDRNHLKRRATFAVAALHGELTGTALALAAELDGFLVEETDAMTEALDRKLAGTNR